MTKHLDNVVKRQLKKQKKLKEKKRKTPEEEFGASGDDDDQQQQEKVAVKETNKSKFLPFNIYLVTNFVCKIRNENSNSR